MPATYTNLIYHVVFSTKGRQEWIDSALRDPLYAYLGGVVKNLRGVVYTIGGVSDHVHLLIGLPASVSVSVGVGKIKANSSKWVNETQAPRERFEWQEGYSAFTVSRSQLPKVRDYLRNQEQHHQQGSYRQEIEGLLRKHGIPFDASNWE
jgi:REP element-mobilizing transposase RayT